MDIGKLVILPLFTTLMILNIFGLQADIKALQPVTSIKAAKLFHHAVTLCFYVLLVMLYIIRTYARKTTTSRSLKVVAVISSFLPLALPFLGNRSDNPDLVGAASCVTIFGMLIALYSLGALGRSFSIIPQARELVQTGPYRFVRHPLYLGELIAIFGVVMGRPSIAATAVSVLITAMVIYRAIEEEKLLAGLFPEYGLYSRNKARFIPGIF